MNILPAGVYFVGDPCYVFSNEIRNKDRWSDLLDVADYFDSGDVVEFEGHKLFAAPTMWGDGVYSDQMWNKYSVDAGLIGAVPQALWDISEEEQKDLHRLGKVVKFEHDFCCFVRGASVICIGEYEIDTDPEENDDYFEDEE